MKAINILKVIKHCFTRHDELKRSLKIDAMRDKLNEKRK